MPTLSATGNWREWWNIEEEENKNHMDEQHQGLGVKMKYEDMTRTAQCKHNWLSRIADVPRGDDATWFNKICHPSQRPRWQVDKEAIGLSRVQQCSSTYSPPS